MLNVYLGLAPILGGQVYMLDTEEAFNVWSIHPANRSLLPEISNMIHETLLEINPYVTSFRNLNILQQEEEHRARNSGREPKAYGLEFFENQTDGIRRFNLPNVSEVAAVFETSDGTPAPSRSVRIYREGASSLILKSTSKHLDPLTYPLIWRHGERGWSIDMKHIGTRVTASRNNLTFREFTCYRLSERDGHFNPICISLSFRNEANLIYICFSLSANPISLEPKQA